MSAEIKDLSPKHVWGYFYDLTQIPRPTGHMEAVTRFMISFGKGLGLETLQDEVGNVLIRKPATPGMEGRKTVTLQSHLDMVPQKNSSVKHDFEKDPIDAYIDGDWVTARETTLGADNGMGAALAMAVLADNSLRHGPIEALFTIDEEQGMDGAFGLKPHFLQGDILLNCDSEKEGELFVGCAGGANVNVSFQFKEDTYIPEGDVAVKVSLSGLKGGHSGVDIHLGRANANKLIFRFLKEAVCDYGARLSSVAGGSLPNAIPREAFAVITIPGDNVESLWELVADYQDMFRTEYMGVEDQIDFVAEMVELPSTLIPEEIQDDLINAIEGCQNGVISMLHDFPGTVESSSNLAIVKTSDELIEVKILVRSSSESRRDSVCSSLESVFALAGAKVEESGHYNGWQPNINSPILNLMKSTYLDLFGKEPEVKVMHAGLECGIIQGAYPDMDMVLVTNAGNKEMFQDCIMLNIIRKYFPVNYHPADVLPENPLSYGLLKRLCGELENGENNNRSTSLRGGWKRNVVSRRNHSDKKYSSRISAAVNRPSDHHSFMRAVSGRTYVMEQQNIGIAPLFVQVFHNNMTDGISEISFTYDAGNFYVSFTEGEVIHKLPVGFGRAADGCVDLHGEHYLVATLGEFARDENDIPVLKLEITFIEECVKRKAHIFFHEDDEIEIRWNETPGKKMILAGLSSITEELSGNFLYNSLLGDNNITTELLHRLMEQTIEPAVRGYLKRPEETDSIDTDE